MVKMHVAIMLIKADIVGNEKILAINDYFSLVNYNDWPKWWKLNIVSHFAQSFFSSSWLGMVEKLNNAHFNPSFQVHGLHDGGEIKHHTLDVLNIDKGLMLGMFLDVIITW